MQQQQNTNKLWSFLYEVPSVEGAIGQEDTVVAESERVDQPDKPGKQGSERRECRECQCSKKQ